MASTASDELDDREIAALRRLLDHQAVVECVTRYARGVDRGDVELVRSAYHADAVEDHGAYIGGIDGLVDFLAWAHRPFPGYQRFVTNVSVDVDDDGHGAHAESYYLCILRRERRDRGGRDGGDGGDGRASRDGEGLLASGGRYVDRLERRDGAWRIARRVVVMEWEGTIEGGAPRHPVTVPPRQDRDDVSYRRPLDVTREPRSPL